MSTSRTPTMAQAVAAILAQRLQEMHTALPGEVQSYDADKQTANVQPLVRVPVEQEDGSTVTEALPICANVPVIFPGAGGMRLTFPLKKGDGVLLVFAEAHLDAWQAKGGLQDPPLRRRFHVADAVAIPGLHPDTSKWTGASTSDATLGADGGPQVVFKTGEIHLGGSSTDPATEPVLLGLTATNALQQFTTTTGTAIASAATALAAAGVAITAAAGALAVPIIGGALAAGPLATVVAQLVIVGTQLGTIGTALSTLASSLPSWRSTKVKTK